MAVRTIKTCAGIGDSIWLMMKLINQTEKFHWKIPDGHPQRGKQLFDLLPQLTESCEYIPGMGYKTIKRNGYRGEWKNTPKQFFLEANTWLEAGKRIEKFLPDLQTSFVLPYQTTIEDTKAAEPFTPLNQNLIGIYTSAHATSQQMSGWGVSEWHEMITLIQNHNPSYKFVFLGAPYDLGISEKVMELMKPQEYINAIGQPLGVSIEILKRLDCFIGFQSGLSIINETIAARQTVMLYNRSLEKMMGAWPDPERIKNGSYKGCLFCPPGEVFNWLIDNNKL